MEEIPTESKYDTLKAGLLETFGLSVAARASFILDIGELGDRKPSELMAEMLSYLGDHKPCILFNEVFLRRMPEQVRLQLPSSDISHDPKKTALKADGLMLKIRNSSRLVNEVATQPTISAATPARVRNAIGKPKPDSNAVCRLHRRWGDNARNCYPPCNYQGNWQAGRH